MIKGGNDMVIPYVLCNRSRARDNKEKINIFTEDLLVDADLYCFLYPEVRDFQRKYGTIAYSILEVQF